MEELLRMIVAEYLNAETISITDFSSIALPGSILIHRMFAAISKATKIDLSVSEYMAIGTFGELKNLINNKKSIPSKPDSLNNEKGDMSYSLAESVINEKISIGFDIETVSKFPKVDDFREDIFYTDSFTPREISYCILKQDPYQSFAGKFAAKEAIIKTGKIEKVHKLKDIEIQNDDDGRPVFRDFCLSISHTGTHAAACAVWLEDGREDSVSNNKIANMENNVDQLNKEIYSLKAKLKFSNIFVAFILIAIVGLYLLEYWGVL